MDDKAGHELATAFLASELMDETRDYLARGRRFETLSSDQLNDEWERAFRSWFSRRDDPREMNDCDAELRLRNVEPPYERVERELKQMHKEIMNEEPHNTAVRAKIAKFLDSKDNPQG
jgi:hypothetical protein